MAEEVARVVELPLGPQSLSDLCMALLQAEINIHYIYPLLVRPSGPAVVLYVDVPAGTSTNIIDLSKVKVIPR